MSLPTFPKNENEIEQYGDQIMAGLSATASLNIPISELAAASPNYGILKNLSLFNPQELRHLNEVIEVSGLPTGDVRWLVEAENRTPEDPVVLFSHGGGYCLGLLPYLPKALKDFYTLAKNDRLSIILWDYTLSLTSQHPAQLNEAALVYNELAKTCSNIILGGDSAGGHLSLTLAKQVHNEGKKISGLFLFSPWVNIHPNKEGSYISNHGKDCLTADVLQGMGELFVESPLLESKALNPYKDDETDWTSVLSDVKIFVYLGGNEVLRDDIWSWMKLAKLSEAVVYEQEGAFHDEILFKAAINPATPTVVKYLQSL